MKRLDQLVGLPAVLRASGKHTGRIVGVSLADHGQKIDGLVLESDGAAKKKRYLPLCEVYLIGDITAIVESKGKAPPHRLRVLEAGQRVLSIDGGRIGMLTNAMIDIETGEISALEISSGWWDDWTQGRTWVRFFSAGQPGGVVVAMTPAHEHT